MPDLTLYHTLFSTCSQKVRFALAKKGLLFESRIVDLSKGEHLEDWYLAINLNGVVPTLVHAGSAIADSSVICEYLDEVFPDPPLSPRDPVSRAAMRAWMRYFEEVPTTAIRAPSFNALFAKGIASRGEAENRRQRERMSHVDFVHETTLRVASGGCWAQSKPRITSLPHAIRFERWFVDAAVPSVPGGRTDRWLSYDFIVPGIFILHGKTFACGTAARCDHGPPPAELTPLLQNIEQQAVTPVSDRRTAYHYATGLIGDSPEMTTQLAQRMDIVMTAFEEDRQMIEAQQAVHDATDPETPMFFAPQDQGPFLMRKLMGRLIHEEREEDREVAR